ncbi:MAG: molybdopterin molybdotransferase MoeA [Eubacterium sp.]|nr:molybdopterin molybdotransferase MoeA [Eubacterium sp.]
MTEYPVGVELEEGQRIILEKTSDCGIEEVYVSESFGRILAEDIKAKESIPPFSKSPYDGYAFRAEDIEKASNENPVTLEITEEIAAGHVPTMRVGKMQAAKILTGAKVPDGADTIEKFEVTEFDKDFVTFFAPVSKGSNIVLEGEDVKCGDTVLEKGILIDAAGCGILAGLGLEKVKVYKKPNVSVISTGDELISVGEELIPGKIRNSSAYTIKALLEEWGMTVKLKGIVKDDPSLIAEAVKEECMWADAVITTGGVSVGDYDCILASMEKLSADVLFWKLKMKPGSAFAFSVYEKSLVISLSGNPSAAVMALIMAARPALYKMAGRSYCMADEIEVKLEDGFPKKSMQRRFVPGRLVIKDGEAYLRMVSKQGNGMLSPLAGVDILGEIPAGSPPLAANTVIKSYKL